MADPKKPGEQPDRQDDPRKPETPSYTPQNRNDQEEDPKPVAREAPDHTPQGRADNA